MSARQTCLRATFNGRHVDVRCDSGWLAAQLQTRLTHLVPPVESGTTEALRIAVTEFAPSCFQLQESTGRSVGGSLEHVLHHARKGITNAFASSTRDFLWLHASAAALDGFVAVLPGPAGVGKSTLVVQLLEHSWRLMGDDAVPIHPDTWLAWPLPFAPEVRTVNSERVDGAWSHFDQPKTIVPVSPGQVVSGPMRVGALIFPEYSGERGDVPEVAPLTVVAAAQTLVAQCAYPADDRVRMVSQIFRLAEAVPSYRLRYGGAKAAAAELTRRRAKLGSG